jgi:hypothetical protein
VIDSGVCVTAESSAATSSIMVVAAASTEASTSLLLRAASAVSPARGGGRREYVEVLLERVVFVVPAGELGRALIGEALEQGQGLRLHRQVFGVHLGHQPELPPRRLRWLPLAGPRFGAAMTTIFSASIRARSTPMV